MEYKPMSGKMLQNRGRCCKSACLHCPYGFTLKRFGLQFKDVEDNLEALKALSQELASRDFSKEDLSLYKFVFIKEELAGAIRVNHIQVKELFLGEDFQDQNLSKEIVESYYFY
mgnify:CR=1 FL=1